MVPYPGTPWDALWQARDAQRRALRRDSNLVGCITLVLTVLMQFVFSFLLITLNAIGVVNLQVSEIYYGLSLAGFLLVYGLAYCLGMGLPAPVVSAIGRRRIHPFSRLENHPAEDRPLSFPTIFFGLMAGLAVCILANVVTSYIVYFLSMFGIQPPEMPEYIDKTGLALLLNVVIFAVFPAILEEMVFRGYVLRLLRPYGDGLALIISSLLFALMHGNILQIPFAMIVGLACGYLVIKTGRVWMSMALHFLNNLMATLLTYTGLYAGSDAVNTKMNLFVFAIIGLTGLFAVVILFALNDPLTRRTAPRRQNHPALLTTGQRAGAVFSSPAMIISIVLSVVSTILTTQ